MIQVTKRFNTPIRKMSMKINFKFWNDWRLNWGVMDYDFKFILFAIQHTNDDDFWDLR